jgi:hypothetical protein
MENRRNKVNKLRPAIMGRKKLNKLRPAIMVGFLPNRLLSSKG